MRFGEDGAYITLSCEGREIAFDRSSTQVKRIPNKLKIKIYRLKYAMVCHKETLKSSMHIV